MSAMDRPVGGKEEEEERGREEEEEENAGLERRWRVESKGDEKQEG